MCSRSEGVSLAYSVRIGGGIKEELNKPRCIGVNVTVLGIFNYPATY
jgi:hypothetical protein